MNEDKRKRSNTPPAALEPINKPLSQAEIDALIPGSYTNQLVSGALQTTSVISASTSWGDCGAVIELYRNHPYKFLDLKTGGGIMKRENYCEIEIVDPYGPGPMPLAYARGYDRDPRMAICKAILAEANQLWR